MKEQWAVLFILLVLWAAMAGAQRTEFSARVVCDPDGSNCDVLSVQPLQDEIFTFTNGLLAALIILVLYAIVTSRMNKPPPAPPPRLPVTPAPPSPKPPAISKAIQKKVAPLPKTMKTKPPTLKKTTAPPSAAAAGDADKMLKELEEKLTKRLAEAESKVVQKSGSVTEVPLFQDVPVGDDGEDKGKARALKTPDMPKTKKLPQKVHEKIKIRKPGKDLIDEELKSMGISLDEKAPLPPEDSRRLQKKKPDQPIQDPKKRAVFNVLEDMKKEVSVPEGAPLLETTKSRLAMRKKQVRIEEEKQSKRDFMKGEREMLVEVPETEKEKEAPEQEEKPREEKEEAARVEAKTQPEEKEKPQKEGKKTKTEIEERRKEEESVIEFDI